MSPRGACASSRRGRQSPAAHNRERRFFRESASYCVPHGVKCSLVSLRIGAELRVLLWCRVRWSAWCWKRGCVRWARLEALMRRAQGGRARAGRWAYSGAVARAPPGACCTSSTAACRRRRRQRRALGLPCCRSTSTTQFRASAGVWHCCGLRGIDPLHTATNYVAWLVLVLMWLGKCSLKYWCVLCIGRHVSFLCKWLMYKWLTIPVCGRCCFRVLT